MTKKFDLKPTIVLSAICVVIVALLAVVNLFTAPIIEAQKNAAANAALLEVFPNGEGFEEVSLTDYTFPASVEKVWKEKNGGAVVQTNVTGYKAGLIIMCGIDSTGKITGAKYIQSNETLSAENGLGDRFIGHDKDSITPDLVAGSTAKLTTGAYYKAIEDSLNAFIILGGGSVDMRDPAQILQDNLNAALGTEGKTFTEWFRVEIVEGVDKIYTNGEGGFVFTIGESFVGVDGEGVKTADATDENKAAASAAYAIVSVSTMQQITELPEQMPKRFVEAYKTASGNYVITAKGAGYGINGDWHTSGEYLVVRVSISADGVIIATETVYHSETENVGGAALGNADFVGQFVGKDKEGAAGVDTLSGATLTTEGYKKAIQTAFEALALLTGGNEE